MLSGSSCILVLLDYHTTIQEYNPKFVKCALNQLRF